MFADFGKSAIVSHLFTIKPEVTIDEYGAVRFITGCTVGLAELGKGVVPDIDKEDVTDIAEDTLDSIKNTIIS